LSDGQPARWDHLPAGWFRCRLSFQTAPNIGTHARFQASNKESGMTRLSSYSVRAALLAVALLGGRVYADGNGLDGKAFHLEIADQANKSCSREHAIFRKGMFESMECRKYGFAKTAYTTQITGNSMTFRAVASSPKEGTNTWTGVVTGDSIQGVLHWEKAGQNPIDYQYKGAALALAKWPKELQKQVTEKAK
jgi:hypothetical protein